MGITYRHSAGFGRRMEYYLIGRMLRDGLDVYVPLVDDFGIDAVIRKQNGDFIEVQIKARSKEVNEGSAALFAAIDHPKRRNNYYFIFYSDRLEIMWIMSSEQFLAEAVQNRNGKNAGKWSIWFNGEKIDKETNKKIEYPRPKFDKYRADDFSMFQHVTKLIVRPMPETAEMQND